MSDLRRAGLLGRSAAAQLIPPGADLPATWPQVRAGASPLSFTSPPPFTSNWDIARMLELHGYQAAIVCEGKELETYLPNVDGRTITGWIASEVGKPFSIAIRQVREGRRPRTRQTIHIDGAVVKRWIPGDPDCTHDGFKPTPITFARFQFAPLNVTDDPAHAAPDGKEDDLGNIKVVIDRRKVDSETERDYGTTRYDIPKTVVHERNKKRVLGGQSVCTGELEAASRSYLVTSRPYKSSDPIPYAAFVFKYRSRDYLIAQDIIQGERPAAAAAAGDKRRHDASQGADAEPEDVKPAKRICVEEHDEARRRLRELKDEMRNIEARLADDLGQPPPNVKREPFPFAVGAVVDLTADDEPGPSRRAVKRELPSEIQVGAAAGTVIDLTDD